MCLICSRNATGTARSFEKHSRGGMRGSGIVAPRASSAPEAALWRGASGVHCAAQTQPRRGVRAAPAQTRRKHGADLERLTPRR